VILTEVESDLVGSTLFAAVSVSVPVFDGAVYIPDEVIVPREAFRVTVLLVVVPWTVAVNESIPEVIEGAVVGDIVTEVTAGLGEGVCAVGWALAGSRGWDINTDWC
jgi:hypothetical protein